MHAPLRIRFLDDASALDARLRFFVTEQLGEKQSLTPEGFLLCQDVPICRTGTMQYGPGEVPVSATPDGFILITREEEDVFTEAHILSYNGKPLCNDHPPEDVNPDNWREYAVGVVLNPRRGTGLVANCIVADILVTDRNAIADVQAGKREVSCGYDADYEEVAVGRGFQRNLIGNHVALVEAGRCGARCSIGDKKPLTGDSAMKFRDNAPSRKRVTIEAKIRKAFADKDENALNEALEEAETKDDEMHIHVHGAGATEQSSGQRGATDDEEDPDKAKTYDAEAEEAFKKETRDAISSIKDSLSEISEKLGMGTGDAEAEKEVEEEAAAETGTQDAGKARDSAGMEQAFRVAVADAEIVAPGIGLPQFDVKQPVKATLASMHKLRCKALDLAWGQPQGRELIEAHHAGELQTSGMKQAAVRTLFRSVAAGQKLLNRQSSKAHDRNHTDAGKQVGRPKSLADINKMNAERWGTKH